MKLLWFHLMPYPELPADFKEKHRSVWVDVNGELFDPAVGHRMYNEYIDELEYAAELGFDAICVNEHHANGYGMMPSPNVIAGALARSGSDAAICVLGNSIALYNPPMRVAEEMAMLDCISGGRLISGFPVGSPMDTCYAYSTNPSTLRERYAEAHELIVRAWTSNEAFPFNGRFNKMRYANCWPKPVQKPHPPIWIPGGGSVETWQYCAERDYVYCFLSYYGYKLAQEQMDGYWREIDRLGKDRNPYRAGFLQFVGLAETEEEAMRLYKEPAEYFYNRCLHVDPRFVSPPGYTTEATIRAAVVSQVALAAGAQSSSKIQTSARARVGRPATDIQGIVDNGYVLLGTPDQVAAKMRQIATDLNIGHFMVLMQFGNMSKELAKYNTRLFAEKVLPQVRDLFDDQWEDHWWPTGMDESQRVRPAAKTQLEAAE